MMNHPECAGCGQMNNFQCPSACYSLDWSNPATAAQNPGCIDPYGRICSGFLPYGSKKR
jgi:hypothetical protein